jgi:hypothetical protein
VIQLIAVLLGLEPDAPEESLRLRPALPDWLPEIRLEHLCVGNATIDLAVTRQSEGAHTLDVSEGHGHLEVTLVES